MPNFLHTTQSHTYHPKKHRTRQVSKKQIERNQFEEINNAIEARRRQPVESEKELTPKEKSLQIIQLALERVSTLIEQKQDASEKELLDFNNALGRSPSRKSLKNLSIIQTKLREILKASTPLVTKETPKPKPVIRQSSLVSLKQALSSLRTDYGNEKNITLSEEDKPWYNNILGIAKQSDWMENITDIQALLQKMIQEFDKV